MLFESKVQLGIASIGLRTSIEHYLCEKYYIWNPKTCTFLKSIIDDSVLIYNETKERPNSNKFF